jgi:hypothetical protein
MLNIGHQGHLMSYFGRQLELQRNLETLNRQWLSTYIQSELNHEEVLAPVARVLELGPFIGQSLVLFNFLFRMGVRDSQSHHLQEGEVW